MRAQNNISHFKHTAHMSRTMTIIPLRTGLKIFFYIYGALNKKVTPLMCMLFCVQITRMKYILVIQETYFMLTIDTL